MDRLANGKKRWSENWKEIGKRKKKAK